MFPSLLQPHANDELYETCSLVSSSDETADNLPGPGRVLGNVYRSVGRRLENKLNRAAERIGYIPTRVDAYYDGKEHEYTVQTTENNAACELCSLVSSSDETADDLPGPGRMLGKLYSHAGRFVVKGLSVVAERRGYGPTLTALRIRDIFEDELLPKRRKFLRKSCKDLVRYMRSGVPSTQEQALDLAIDLAIENDHLRLLLKDLGFKTIESFTANPRIWRFREYTLYDRTQKTLVALENSKIRYLVSSIFACHEDHTTRSSLQDDLRKHLLDETSSFLVLRFLHQGIRHEHSAMMREDAIHTLTSHLGPKLSEMGDSIEWSELDGILQTISSEYLQTPMFYEHIFEIVFSYADKLPKSLMPLRAFASLLETDNIRDFRSAYCSLHNVALSMGNSRAIKTSTYSQQYLRPLLSRLDDPIDKELATLFESHDRLGAASSDSDKFMPELAKGINSEDEDTVRQAVKKARMVLSLSRYTRRRMIQALQATRFSETDIFKSLLEETACLPTECAFRGQEECPEHLVHLRKIYRHCAKDGVLVHLSGSNPSCNGECGAAEEHVLEYDREDVLFLDISDFDEFSMKDHYPLFAGRGNGGKPLYAASLYMNESRVSTQLGVIRDGVSPRDLRCKLHFSHKIEKSTPILINVPVLKYNPASYGACSYYQNQEENQDQDGFTWRMDPTGPFSWKFNQRLTGKRKDPRRQDEVDIRTDLLWIEAFENVFVEPEDDIDEDEDAN